MCSRRFCGSLEVGTNSVHLPLIHRDTTVLNEGGFRVVELRCTVTVSIVAHFVVVPERKCQYQVRRGGA